MFTSLLGALCVSVVGFSAFAEEARHVIYLHGRIVQDQQSARPQHPEHGPYELDKIRDAFRMRGFRLTSEIRPRPVSVSDAADHVVEQVRALLSSGVPAERITVVGASMGAAIGFRVASRLQNDDIRFAFLGPCSSRNFPAVAEEEGKRVAGKILVIRDESDVSSEQCPRWTEGNARELVIDTGRGHGFLYSPMLEWLDPVSRWILSGELP